MRIWEKRAPGKQPESGRYEQILGVPYYINRYNDELHFSSRQPISSNGIDGRKDLDARFRTGLSVAEERPGALRQWLRWYDAQGNWVPTEAEMVQRSEQRAELSDQRAELAERRAEELAQRLRAWTRTLKKTTRYA